MSLDKIPGYAEALKVIEANLSPRALYLRDLERYVDGSQYEGRPDWFSAEKPLFERAPCVVYPIVQSAIDSNVDLLLGEGRFPTFGLDGLEGEDAEEFDKGLSAVVQQSRFAAASREVFAAAQGSSTGCAVFGIRANRLFIDTVRARWCTPKLDTEGGTVSLEIRYPYLFIDRDPKTGQQTAKAKIFRRVIDAARDVTYIHADATLQGIEPAWTEDATLTFQHALGFCPVVWYPHMRGCAIVNDVDGRALHQHLLDEIRAHDFALSQRHRAALMAGDPQWTEIGVEPGFNPSSAGRAAEAIASANGKPGETPTGMYVSAPARNRKSRKKTPGEVWQYPKGADVKLHTLPGDALKAIDEHARDLRIKIAESLGVVFIDADTIPKGSNLAARALEALKARQLDRCDQYRSDFADGFLLPSLGMLIRTAIAKNLGIQGLDAIKKAINTVGDQWSWRAPSFTPTWGRYFRLDADEEQKQVALVAQALDAKVVTKRAAVEKLRGVFEVKDIDAFLQDIEDESNAAMQQQMQLAADMMGADNGGASGGSGDSGNGDAGTPSRGSRGRRPPPKGAKDGASPPPK